MKKTEIKKLLKNEKIPYWEIAEELGISENTFVRRMRGDLKEMKQADIETILNAVSAIRKKRNSL